MEHVYVCAYSHVVMLMLSGEKLAKKLDKRLVEHRASGGTCLWFFLIA